MPSVDSYRIKRVRFFGRKVRRRIMRDDFGEEHVAPPLFNSFQMLMRPFTGADTVPK